MDAVVEDLVGLDDHDLLAGGVTDGVAEARSSAVHPSSCATSCPTRSDGSDRRTPRSATELIEALTEIRNRRDQEIAQDHELAWEHGTLPSALIG